MTLLLGMKSFCSPEKWAIKKGVGEEAQAFKGRQGVSSITTQQEDNRRLTIFTFLFNK